ncbi:MAG: hypothetical protein ICV60_13180 [Pyrinomonadaceae bacterium]|nr:hypothetical protein [Pyrinomonadaceae bacterium]
MDDGMPLVEGSELKTVYDVHNAPTEILPEMPLPQKQETKAKTQEKEAENKRNIAKKSETKKNIIAFFIILLASVLIVMISFELIFPGLNPYWWSLARLAPGTVGKYTRISWQSEQTRARLKNTDAYSVEYSGTINGNYKYIEMALYNFSSAEAANGGLQVIKEESVANQMIVLNEGVKEKGGVKVGNRLLMTRDSKNGPFLLLWTDGSVLFSAKTANTTSQEDLLDFEYNFPY